MTAAKVDLGWKLFYDGRLSGRSRSSCVDCHVPEHGYAGVEVAQGFHRNVPTVYNRAYGVFEFWDGQGGQSLEQLVSGVLSTLNQTSTDRYWQRLRSVPGYRTLFDRAFGQEPNALNTVQAIATFERVLLAGDSPVDRFQAGDMSALSIEAQLGSELFFGKAGCVGCHSGPNYTDEGFHNTGIGRLDRRRRFYPVGVGKPTFPELGRFNVTHKRADWGAFKTPTLRELTSTAPYMHDGSLATLNEVVDYYNGGGDAVGEQDPSVRPLHLDPGECRALVAFLTSLSSDARAVARPKLPE